ncbi:hypothetical protein CPB83DRAFT_786831 [Crepidotus variabilis]|uniref:Eisosome component PIL1-domain-containing protein n=1 Tax=Crepidotus variabilis TaxID=179855 RepID=A0A9P6JSL5_9AGAR|nr:hypothetical protein CPB83DRAFT_786831 [Crepidotus variabilis]
MFRTAATKIAHNSTLPALAGNRDLRPLQDLINAEKAVLISLQKLSVDFSKAAETLRTWGLSEGDDLGDTLSASTTVINHFASALTGYASHGHAMREYLKAIRTREENLEELKRRRRTVMKKAEDADRKLSKMSQEHKNYQMQNETLNKLREEIRTMDTEIMMEEGSLWDFKRTSTKMLLGLKFGGLVECCEKGTIVGEFGRMIISEIPEEQAQHGLNRTLYQGHPNTEALVSDAHHAISEVVLSTVPAAGVRERRQYQPPSDPPKDAGFSGGPGPFHDSKPMPPPPRVSSDYPPPPRPYSNDYPSSPASLNKPQAYPWSANGDQPSPHQAYPNEQQTVDDFGVNPPRTSGGPMFDPDATGGRFATFPVKGRQGGGYSLQDTPSLNSHHEIEPSFASSIAAALDHKDPPPSINTASVAPLQFAPRAQPPSQAPPVNPGNPWADATLANHSQKLTISDNDDALLAYMTSVDDDGDYDESPNRHSVFQGPKGAAPPAIYEDPTRSHSRHVQFGEVTDVDEELEKRASAERDRHSDDHEHRRISVGPPTLPPPTLPPSSFDHQDDSYFNQDSRLGRHTEEPHLGETPTPIPEHTIPPNLSPEDEEKKLNAAAARQITLELEALNANPPDPQRRPSMDAIAQRERENELAPPSEGSHDSYSPLPSPLAPPSAPFTRRSVSPHPYPELGSGGSPQSPYGQPQSSPLASPYTPTPTGPPASYSPYGQPEQPQPLAPSSNLPPRLQALSSPYERQESQLPPRFQTSPKPVYQSPPRFQQAGVSPLSTPLSELRGAGLSATKSSSSLQSAYSPLATPGGGVRTISAAAFKRPRNMSGEVTPIGGGSPGMMSKGLPPISLPSSRSTSMSGGPPLPASPAAQPAGLPPPEANRNSHAGSDYDYIDAYMDNSGPPSPNHQEPGYDQGQHPQGAPAGGYGSGKYATQLDEGGLR